MSKLIPLTLVLTLLITGCASKSFIEGEVRHRYEPLPIDDAQPNESAIVKATQGIVIWNVDGEKYASTIKMAFGGGLTSILLKEGSHSIACRRRGQNISIRGIYYKENHEYLIDFIEIEEGDKFTIHYWVKDLTDNIVVLGQERQKSDFQDE